MVYGISGPRRFTGLNNFPEGDGFGIIALLNWAERLLADVAQLAEHPPCKRAVTSSSLVVGS